MPALDIDALYRSHGPSVLRRARALMGNDADAKEVLHDVFTSLCQHPEQFEGRSSPMTFLYRATTNRCLNAIRNSRTRLRLLEHNAASAVHDPGPEATAVVRGALAELPDDIATAVVYYYVDEMSHAEVAELMGCSRRHVGNLLARFHERQAKAEVRC
jgi:RNA polymerase sigma factor (sigma-70 family)